MNVVGQKWSGVIRNSQVWSSVVKCGQVLSRNCQGLSERMGISQMTIPDNTHLTIPDNTHLTTPDYIWQYLTTLDNT